MIGRASDSFTLQATASDSPRNAAIRSIVSPILLFGVEAPAVQRHKARNIPEEKALENSLVGSALEFFEEFLDDGPLRPHVLIASLDEKRSVLGME
jgi:hypothetical protein